MPPAGLPPAHLASHSLKGCKVTSQELDSSVYSPNTETALWARCRHPDPLPPHGERGFQTTTTRLHIPRLLTSRDWPQGGGSIQPGPAARESAVRHEDEPSATEGYLSAEEGESSEVLCSLGKDSGSPVQAAFPPPHDKTTRFPSPTPSSLTIP